jgi:calcium-dependent protein kinase
MQLGTLIGTGSYGLVRSMELEGQQVAVKVLTKKRGAQARGKVLKKIAREIDLLTRLQECCNVVQLLTVFEDEEHAYLVCELCRGGDLEKLLMERGPFSERAAARVVYEALKMVAACHSNNVIHGDVKPANFLLRQPYKDPLGHLDAGKLQGAWLKSIDFGCSQVVPKGQRLTRRTGTPVYMAPEIFTRQYGLEADLWSVGMMFYQLIAKRFPFWATLEECHNKSITEVMERVLNGEIPLDYGPWLRMSPEGLDLMEQLTHRTPSRRISADNALKHAWFKRQLHSAPPAPPQRSNIIPKSTKPKTVRKPTLQASEPQLAQEDLRDVDPTPTSTPAPSPPQSPRQEPQSPPPSPRGRGGDAGGSWEPGLVPSLMPA